VNTAETACVENQNIQVDTTTNVTRETWLKMMPRYRIRNEGEPIRTEDQVIIKSVKTETSLNVSSEFVQDELVPEGILEVNAGSQSFGR
jgi:inositol 1,4,5-triphosphate receptor type 1